MALCLVKERQVEDGKEKAAGRYQRSRQFRMIVWVLPHLPKEDEERLENAANLGTVLEQIQREDGIALEAPLPERKDGDEDGKDAEERNDGLVCPWLGLTTPLQWQKERGDEAKAEDGADEVYAAPLLPGGEVLLAFARLGGLAGKEEDDDGNGDTTEWQVDVETPAPADVIGEGTLIMRT